MRRNGSPYNEVLTTKEVAELLGTHVETVRRFARAGEIPCFKVGKDWRFARDEIMAWMRDGASHASNEFVLIVDDEAQVGELIVARLRKLGVNAQNVTDGAAGLFLVAQRRPMLILLDLVMPKMNGPQFLENLTQMGVDVPVAIITGFPDSELMLQAAQYGPLMLITKPVNITHIRRCLAMICPSLSATAAGV